MKTKYSSLIRVIQLILITSILLFSSIEKSNAQKFEIGLFTGTSFYTGDLSEVQAVFKGCHFFSGVIARYNLNPFLTIKSSLLYGKISGADSNLNAIEKVEARNLSFKSNIFEGSIQAELNFHKLLKIKTSFPYIFGGIALLRFNPKAFINDQWYA